MQGWAVNTLLSQLLSDETVTAAVIALVVAVLEASRRRLIALAADEAVIEAGARHPNQPMRAELHARKLLSEKPRHGRPLTARGTETAVLRATTRAAKRAGRMGR